MNSKENKAKTLIELEDRLNQFNYNQIKLGSLLSFHFSKIYQGKYKFRLGGRILHLMYTFLKVFLRKKNKKDFGKEFMFFKSANIRHYNQLSDSVCFNDILHERLEIISEEKVEIFNLVLYNFSLKDGFLGFVFMIKFLKTFRKVFKPYYPELESRLCIYFDLYTQILKATSVQYFLKNQSKLVLVGGDFDRGKDSSVWFSVSNSLNIFSFTLQHGVINPPYGYFPLVSKEMWIWGELAFNQLITCGVDKNRLRIVGTPIIEKCSISKERILEIKERLNLLSNERILVLALSSVDYTNDYSLVRFLDEIRKKYGRSNEKYYIKVHPSKNPEIYSWVSKEFDIEVWPNNISYCEFINIVDVLFVYNSGIALEALIYGKKVGILNPLNNTNGNILYLSKTLNIPILNEIGDYPSFEVFDGLFLVDKIAHLLGDDAKVEIVKNILVTLHSLKK